MNFFGGIFGIGMQDRLAPHELYRKGVEIYRRSGATEEVARLMRQAGEGGNGSAWAFLGYQYQTGEGVGQNAEKAVECYKKSAELKCGLGLYNLGSAYDNGLGVSRDKETAFEYFQKSADVGHGDGLNTVGDWRAQGVVVRRDYAKAVQCFKAAFALGNTEAAFGLALCLEHGHGGVTDQERAAVFYRIAAAAGCSRTQGRATLPMPSRELVSEVLNGNPRLLEASVLGDADRIQTLIQHYGVDIDSPVNPDGDTLLTRSIRTGQMELAKRLVAMGAGVNIPLHNGRTALMTAAGVGDVDMVRTLLAAGAKIDWQKSGGNTALMYAVSKRRGAAVQALLEAGADRGMKDDEGMDAGDYARSFAPELRSMFS